MGFPSHPGEQIISPTGEALAIPIPGSAFPAPTVSTAAASQAAASTPSNGKFAALTGNFDTGEMGIVEIREDDGKLWVVAPNAPHMERVPETAIDKFVAQPVGAPVSFQRDAAGKVVGITVILPGGREVKGKKVS